MDQKVTMELHESEARLIEFIRQLRYGSIERLEVQDGLPVLAECVRAKVKFTEKQRKEVKRL